MKKISMFFIGLVAFFSVNSLVYAGCKNLDSQGICHDNEKSEEDNTKHVDGDTYWQWQTTGFRLSINTNTGGQVATTNYGDELGRTVQAANGESKVTYITDGDEPTFSKQNVSVSSQQDFIDLFVNHGFDKNKLNDVMDKYNSGVTDAINEALFDPALFDGDSMAYLSAVKGVLTDLGVDPSYIATEADLKNLFAVVEPTYVVSLNGSLYYGTAYELGSAIKKTDTYWKLNSAIGQKFQCSNYLNGSLSGSQGAANSVAGFENDNVYFGNISINTDVADKVCNNICTDADKKAGICSVSSNGNVQFTLDYILGANGIGMHVTWLYPNSDCPDGSCDKPVEVNCGTINSYNGHADYDKNPLTNDKVPEISNIVKSYANEMDLNAEDVYNYYISYCTIEPELEPEQCDPIAGAYPCGSMTAVIYSDDDGSHGSPEEFLEACGTNDSFYDGNLSGQNYCPVYCFENLEAKLFSQSITVVAGRYVPFSNYSNTITGSRTCYTKIKTTKFNADLASYNTTTLTSYKEYLLEQEKSAKISESYRDAEEESSRCAASTCSAYSYKDSKGTTVCTIKYNENGTLQENTCVGVNLNNTTSSCTAYHVTYGTYYPGKSYSVKFTGADNKTTTLSGSYSGWCSNDAEPVKADVNDAYNSYQTALKNAMAAVQEMYKCLNWEPNKVYQVSPTMTLDYSDGVRYTYSSGLSGGTSYSDNDDHGKTDAPFDGGNAWIYSCSGGDGSGKCEKNEYLGVMPKETHLYKRSAVSNYTLSSVGSYQYIEKGNNLSQHTAPNSSYITLAGNLPVSYSASEGTGHHINIDYGNLGHVVTGKIDDYFLSSPLYQDVYGKWRCNFTIDSKLIKTDGLNLIYRPIDLANPFPDIDGQTRQTGSNWCSTGNCNTNNPVVQEVITNKQDVRSRTPMYSFTITPSIIKQIRLYNKANGYDDFNLKCDSDGKSCVSSFVTSVINGNLNNSGFNANPSGTCLQTRDSNDFYACQPKAN